MKKFLVFLYYQLYNQLRILKRPYFFLLRRLILFNNYFSGINKVNIGGGANFFGFGWMNLDVISSINTKQILFQPSTILPFASDKLELVYSSHCFEHLDDNTVDRLLEESYRILKKSGRILIKIPDFDRIKDQYMKRNLGFLQNLGQDSVIWTWKKFGVEINAENYYSMLICGYWNKAYGDHFSGQINSNNKEAYHGPARIPHDQHVIILNKENIRDISKDLNKYALADEDFHRFNHQNAWSYHQFRELLQSKGFDFIHLDKVSILKEYGDIPDILSMVDWSMYLLAKKI